MDTHHNYVAGDWVAGESTGPDINPSNTDESVGEYAKAAQDQAAMAITAAADAFPAWSRSGMPRSRRSRTRSQTQSACAVSS